MGDPSLFRFSSFAAAGTASVDVNLHNAIGVAQLATTSWSHNSNDSYAAMNSRVM
jgi:hypothetical protein